MKKIFAHPSDRSFDGRKIASFGGVAIFFGFMISLTITGSLFGKGLLVNEFLGLIAASLIMFYSGVKDDLLELTPFKKIVAQLFSSAIIIFLSHVRIINFFGLFGLYELPYMVSVLFTFLFFILIINAYNFVDGIDGLAGSIGLIIFIFFGFYFYINKVFFQCLISFSIVGSLIAFLKFNTTGSCKVFMGDTGSLLIGFLIVYQSIIFLELNNSIEVFFYLNNSPVFISALISYPLIDTIRVVIIRLKKGKNLFKGDHNHIHHFFLNLGFSHIKSTIIIVFLFLLVLLSTFFLQHLDINLGVFCVLIISVVLYVFLPAAKRKAFSKIKFNCSLMKYLTKF